MKELKEIIIERPAKMLIHRISGEWQKELRLCTHCLKTSVEDKPEHRKGYVPNVTKEDTKTVCVHCGKEYYEEDIEERSYVSVMSYDEWNFGYISTIRYNEKDTFYMEYVRYILNVNSYERDEEHELKTIKLDMQEETIVVDFHYENYKTKPGSKFIGAIYNKDTGEKIKCLKGTLTDIFYRSINAQVLNSLRLAPGASNLDELIYGIKETYRKYPNYLKMGLAVIADKNNPDLTKRLENSETYRELIKEYVDKETQELINGTKVYSSNIYANYLLAKFPTDDKRYYQLFDKYAIERTYYTMQIPEYCISDVVKYCLDYDYSDEETDLFLQMLYKQAYPHHKIGIIRQMQAVYQKVGLPIEKLPKELFIYISRAEAIEKLVKCRWGSMGVSCKYKDTWINFENDDMTNAVNKAIGYKQNYTFLNKLLRHDYKDCVFLVKDTDYYLIVASEYSKEKGSHLVITNFYNKDKEVTNEQEKEKILEEIKKLAKKNKRKRGNK